MASRLAGCNVDTLPTPVCHTPDSSHTPDIPHVQVVEVLLKYNANVNDQNVDGHTALMFAYNGRNQVASLLDKYSG